MLQIIRQALDFCHSSYFQYTYQSPDKQIQCLLEEHENILFVCIRGSDHIKDWLGTNLHFCTIYPYMDKQIGVHRGFYEAKNGIIDQIYKHLLENDFKEVIFTGHSLGGAIAEIIALNFVLDYPEEHKISVITFGSANSGNSKFKEFFQENINESYSIKNLFDIITYLLFFYKDPAHIKFIRPAIDLNLHGLNAYHKVLDQF